METIKRLRIGVWTTSAEALVAVLSLGLWARAARVQAEFAAILTDRLVRQGVAVQSVAMQRPFSLRLEIVLRGTSVGTRRSPEDAFAMFAVEREVSPVKRSGFRADSFLTILNNPEGIPIYCEQSWVKPGIPDRLPPSKLDDATTAERVAVRLEPAGLSLVAVEAVSDEDGWQTVTLTPVAPEGAVGDRALPSFRLPCVPLSRDSTATTGRKSSRSGCT